MHSLPSLNASHPNVAAVEARLDQLSEPAEPVWLMARVAALLSPYYERDVPQGVREMEAEDWAAALAEFPRWAVERAVRWWKSDANPNRRKRPLEGDIADRCRHEMQAVTAARIRLRLPAPPTEPERIGPTPEEQADRKAIADEVMARFLGGHRMEAAE